MEAVFHYLWWLQSAVSQSPAEVSSRPKRSAVEGGPPFWLNDSRGCVPTVNRCNSPALLSKWELQSLLSFH
jgi:hypothetical protein